MKYTSTRDNTLRVSAAQAILTGLAPNSGLFVPTEFPQLSYECVMGQSYPEAAQTILSAFLTDYSADFLRKSTEASYGGDNFAGKAGFVAPVENDIYALELWHGPTCAFKDYALQLMPRLLTEAKQILGDTSTTKILVATSGDTGKAALAGYQDLAGIKIAVFYPNDGTSEIQRLQMATQEGENVAVYAVEGNFDDAQTGVKRVFSDAALAQTLAQKGEHLSSANSINWGRLVPQIVYYFYAYAQLVAQEKITAGARVSFCVPTGNFGDILAGYYAKRMGLPVDKLICASNSNNVLTDFLRTGTYDANRDFHRTTSPSMDILVSSNLERLLYHVADSDAVNAWMQSLAETGKYTVTPDVLATIQETFMAGCADDAQVAAQIKQEYAQNAYLSDTHTAVALRVARESVLDTPCVVLSTACPYKFSGDVLGALGEVVPSDEFATMQALNAKTGMPVPESLACLNEKPVRFTQVIAKEDIATVALSL